MEVLQKDAALGSPSSVFYFLLLPTLMLWYIYWRLSRAHLYRLAGRLPGPRGLPIVGHLFDVIGPASSVNSFGFYSLPSQFHIIFIYIYFILLYLFYFILSIAGQKWRSHRKLIAPTFHLNVLKSFIELFNENSKNVVRKLRAEDGRTFDCHDYMSEATVEILLETAMGVSKKTQDKSGFEYAMAVMRMCDILHARHRSFFLRNEFVFTLTRYYKEQGRLLNIIHGLTTKVIRSKKAAFEQGTRGSLAQCELKAAALEREREQQEQAESPASEAKNPIPTPTTTTGTTTSTSTGTPVAGLSYGQSAGLKDDLDVEDNDIGEKKRLAFLDLMLESAQNGALITDTEIKEQVDTIMFEGHDTTAAGSSFFLSLMGIHQGIQDRVLAELDTIFGDSQRPATFQDTLEMKYLERCLMETLRMYPPVPLIARELQEDLKLNSGNYVIPRGATVTVATVLLHRNPKVYANPNVFDPDNFLPERQANRHYYAFVPFSAGPRSCVGRKYAMLKLKILLSTILRNYRVYSDLSESDFKLQADIILKREEGFRIRLQPRTR
ncbi:hypothetical protein KR200_002027 [Drosophila serrata]|nr:hypothetical protein KR200_002027 [Drosophila serrata]